MVEHQPQTARVMEEGEGKNNCERHPKRELLMDRHARESIEEKKSRRSNFKAQLGHSSYIRNGLRKSGPTPQRGHFNRSP